MFGRVVIALGVAWFVSACGSSAPSSSSPRASTGIQPSIAVDTDRFPHGVHTGNRAEIRNYQGRGLGCIDCHDQTAVIAGKVARPGVSQHAPCDACHAAEFAKPPGPLCKVCHTSVDPFRAGASPLHDYPMRGTTQVLASTFSHRQHLDSDAMESATGAHLACTDCHVRDATTRDPQVPGHAACVRCHEHQPTVKAKLGMEACERCHPSRNVELTRGRVFITGDLKFHHATHETDKAGAQVACTTCHAGVADATSRDQMSVPAMAQCAQCHDDASKSPDRVRMSKCGVCHSEIDTGTPPADHGGVASAGTRPTDHTLYFRTHHSDAAAAPNSPCRFCHTEVTGAREDSCFQCHEVMKPRDHDLVFRTDHGREAQTDATRCASCHTPESCVACHSVPPRSHTPLGEWRLGGHAEPARFGLTACLTCHQYEDTCAKCHRGTR